MLDRDWGSKPTPPDKNFQSPVWGSSSTSGGLNPPSPPINRTLIVPIPKSNQCSKKALTYDDFRGIAISLVIYKIFEHCILKRYQWLFTTSKKQFGFKKGTSCSQCRAIRVSRSTVDTIIGGGCTAKLCAIDLSKAFDK